MSHILHCGDGIAGMAALAERSVDHVITDPPYEAEAHTLQRRTKDAKNGHNARTEQDGSRGRLPGVTPISFAPITHEQRLAAALNMARIARRWIIVFCQAEAVALWRDALVAFEQAKYRRAMIWVKPDAQPQLTGDGPGMGYESMVVAHALGRGRARWNAGGKVGIYVFNKNADEQGAPRLHPTQKPIGLLEQLVRDFTDPGELICDPFAGSGTLHAAAKRLGRRAVGWEIHEPWHAAALKRIEGTREQMEFAAPRPRRPRQLPLSVPGNGGEGA